MRILIVGSEAEYAIERYFREHLAALGAETRIYPSADIVTSFRTRNLVNRVLFRSGAMRNYGKVNRGLCAAAAEFRPDFIWVFKGMEIRPSTLADLGRRFRLANFNPDHPFIIAGVGSGNANVRDSVGLYHLHFCYHGGLMREIAERFGIRTVRLPFAYDTGDLVYTDPECIQEIGRVCLQANPDRFRVAAVGRLAGAGIEVDVFGHGWGRTALKANSRVRISPILPRPEFWRKNQEYRVQLNVFREHNQDSHNMRTFEIPAVGGIQLAPHSAEQEEFFRAGAEAFFFRDDAEMVAKARAILALPSSAAREVRNAARRRSRDSGYTFAHRAATALAAFETQRL